VLFICPSILSSPSPPIPSSVTHSLYSKTTLCQTAPCPTPLPICTQLVYPLTHVQVSN
jgi:hypothetical protein